MSGPPVGLVDVLQHCQNGIATILRDRTARSECAKALAELLRTLLPQAALVGCLLQDEGRPCLVLRPAEEDEERQQILLQSLLSPNKAEAPAMRTLSLDGWPNVRLLAASIGDDGTAWGFLVVGLPAAAPAEDVAVAQAVLTVAATATSWRWRLETLRREQSELVRFALVGQAFAGLAHDLNNALNSMMLQTSVVQLRVDPQVRQDLAAIRQHVVQAAGLVRSLQHVVQERREQSYAVDLNSVLRELLQEEPELRRRLTLQLPEQGPHVDSTRSAVKQLLRLLLEGVCAGTKAAVSAATGVPEGKAALTLTIADAGSDVPSVEALLWQNLDEVGRQAGQSLLRQLGGTATVNRDAAGTASLGIVWERMA